MGRTILTAELVLVLVLVYSQMVTVCIGTGVQFYCFADVHFILVTTGNLLARPLRPLQQPVHDCSIFMTLPATLAYEFNMYA